MATWCKALFSSSFDPIFSPLFPSTSRSLLSSPSNSSVSLVDCSGLSACSNSPALNSTYSSIYPLPSYKRHLLALPISFPFKKQICRAAEYKFPDPIPEFADFETEKFRTHLLKKLSKKDIYGDAIEEIVGICTEIFSTFLHTEYGGPGTLLVIPFIDMADTLNERGLPGGPQAARAAVKWAQDHVDKDWNEWTGGD